MKFQKNTINLILIEGNNSKRDAFENTLSGLESVSSVKAFSGIKSCMQHLDDLDTQMPNVLFLDVRNSKGNIQSIRRERKYNDLSIAVYNADASNSAEDSFVAGANIYIRKASDSSELERLLKKAVTTDCQYFSGKLNKETYFIAV